MLPNSEFEYLESWYFKRRELIKREIFTRERLHSFFYLENPEKYKNEEIIKFYADRKGVISPHLEIEESKIRNNVYKNTTFENKFQTEEIANFFNDNEFWSDINHIATIIYYKPNILEEKELDESKLFLYSYNQNNEEFVKEVKKRGIELIENARSYMKFHKEYIR